MKVALLYPPYHFHPPLWPFSRPTLVLAHLYAILENEGVGDLEALDLDLKFNHAKEPVEYFLRKAQARVEEAEPDVICVSCKAAQFPFSALFSRRYKRVHPEVKIVMGGWMPTLAPEVTLQLSQCDAVIRGEGERSLPALLREIKGNEEEWHIEGVSFRSQTSEKIIHNPNAKALTQKELDALPLPRYDVLPPLEVYQPGLLKPCFSVQASRGCTNHRCVFCWNSTKNCDTSWRARSPERVVEEIRHLVDTYGAQVLFFADDCFGADPVWLKTFIAMMKAEFMLGEIEYIASMRVDTVPQELLKDFFTSGLRTIFHGIESGSPRCWTSLGKNLPDHVTRQYILNLIENEVRNRISPICSFIVAFPDETASDLDQTISLCEELAMRGSIFSLQILAPNEGTGIYYNDHFRTLIEPCDLYTEFGESENLNPELRTVFGDALIEFMDYLPDFRLVRPAMPLDQLKKKYTFLGQIASYDGAIQRKYKVYTLSQDSSKDRERGNRLIKTIRSVLKRFR